MCTPPTLGRPRLLVLPGFKATTCLTVVLLVCLETVLLSTVSNCAKTFYMHWNTTNSIFRIDNTDHIIDVNKGNLAFEYDQVHIICPVYEPGTFDNETEKYIIYNVSKVEYETCRITNANPRIIAICDKPQKLMFFTITFRPFTPQPGGLEFLPGNDYYFISTSSKDDLHRRIGGRCSTNNMKVVFKVCCAAPAVPELVGGMTAGGHAVGGGADGAQSTAVAAIPSSSGAIGSASAGGSSSAGGSGNSGTLSGSSSGSSSSSGSLNGGHGGSGSGGSTGVSINTNIEQRTNGRNNNYGGGGNNNDGGDMVPSTMSWPRWSHTQTQPTTSVNGQGQGNGYQQFYPPSHSATSARPMSGKNGGANGNEATNHQNNNSNYGPSHKPTKKTSEYDKHPNEVVKNEELTYNSAAAARPGRGTSRGTTGTSCWWHRLALTALLSAITVARYFWSFAAAAVLGDRVVVQPAAVRRRGPTAPAAAAAEVVVAAAAAAAVGDEPRPDNVAAQVLVDHPPRCRWQQHKEHPHSCASSAAGVSCRLSDARACCSWQSDAERPNSSSSSSGSGSSSRRPAAARRWCQR